MKVTHEEMLKDLLVEVEIETIRPDSATAKFIQSVEKYRQETGAITPKQAEIIEKIHKDFIG